MRPSGFTLIELLVVISIIAILASMLMPAISMVRQAAQSATCQSNERQAGISLMAYDADHQSLPLAVDFGYVWQTGWSKRGDWDIVLLDFMGESTSKFLQCPMDHVSKEGTVTSANGTSYTGRKSYAMAGTYHLAGLPPAVAAEISWTQLWNWSPAAVSGAMSVGRITDPSNSMLVGERQTSDYTLGVCWYSMLGNSWDMAEAHRGKSNVLFGDGHVGVTTRTASIGSGTPGDAYQFARGMWTITQGD